VPRASHADRSLGTNGRRLFLLLCAGLERRENTEIARGSLARLSPVTWQLPYSRFKHGTGLGDGKGKSWASELRIPGSLEDDSCTTVDSWGKDTIAEFSRRQSLGYKL
jgi:hypothetical protein